jgi:hypothetical protein
LKGNPKSNLTKSSLVFLLLPVVFCLTLGAQPPAAADDISHSKAEVRFDFVRVGIPIPKFTLDIRNDGIGTYTAEDSSWGQTQQVHRDFTLTTATTTRIFTLARAVHPATCASKAKNIADSGTKTFTYINSGTTSSCTYNYTEAKDLQTLTDIFQGMTETMDQGRRLDFLHRFDRLGLDEAIAFLAEETSSGRAIEIGIIEPTLRSIVADAQVMQRVRTKAAALLALIPAPGEQRRPG